MCCRTISISGFSRWFGVSLKLGFVSNLEQLRAQHVAQGHLVTKNVCSFAGRVWFFRVSPLSGFLLRALQLRGLENSLLSSVYSIYLTWVWHCWLFSLLRVLTILLSCSQVLVARARTSNGYILYIDLTIVVHNLWTSTAMIVHRHIFTCSYDQFMLPASKNEYMYLPTCTCT